MVKKWIDANEIDKEELPNNLIKYDRLMKKKPNFDKNDEKSINIYNKNEYVIFKVKKGYILYNKNKLFKEGHTHLKSYKMAKIIINNCIYKKIPKTDNIYLLESHIRVSTNDKYKKLIEEIIEAKRSKDKTKYINRGK